MIYIGVIIILIVLIYMKNTIEELYTIQEIQNDINKDFQRGIDKMMETLGTHVREETEVYKLIKNFGKEE